MATTTANVYFITTDLEDAGFTTADENSGGFFQVGVSAGTQTSFTELASGSANPYLAPGGTATHPVPTSIGSLAIDPATQSYFYVDQLGANNGTTYRYNATIYAGNAVTGVPNNIPLHMALTSTQGNAGDFSSIDDILVNQASATLYFTQTVFTNAFAPVSGSTGLYSMPEAGGTATLLTNHATTATGATIALTEPDAIAYDATDNLIFFTDSTGQGDLGINTTSVNDIDVYNIVTGRTQVLFTEPFVPDAVSPDYYGGNVLDGLAVDPASHNLYYTSNDVYDSLTTDSYSATNDGIYKVGFSTVGGVVSLGATTTLYSGANAFDPARIALDVANGVFYVDGNVQVSDPNQPTFQVIPTQAGVFEGSLAASNSAPLTRVTSAAETTGGTETSESVQQGELLGIGSLNTPTDGNVIVEDVPIVTAGSTVTYTSGSAGVTTDAALGATSGTAVNFLSGRVVIAGFEAGDVLAAATTGTNIVASYTGSTLALTGKDSVAHYQQVLDSVTFRNTTADPTASGASVSRTLTYTVSDGLSASSANSSVTILVPPVVTPGSPGTVFTGGGPAVAADPVLTLTDTTSTTLNSATITISSGFQAGDSLVFVNTANITGSYNTATGVLSLSGVASTALYQAAIRSITFGVSPAIADPTAGGTDTSRTLSYVVSDAALSSATTTSTVSVVVPAPTITGTVGNQATTDQVPVNPFATVTIAEVDSGAKPTVSFTLLRNGSATDADGTLSGTGLTKTGVGSYSLAAAAPATLTSEIDALVFTPTRNQVAVGSAVNTTFFLTAAFGGTSVSDSLTSVNATDVPCFCAGTRILTARGEVAVEQLVAGEQVVTASGDLRPIVWIGTRRYAGRFLRANPAVQPIRIRAGALGANVPVRDLHVSPLHALFIDGLLVPAGALVNGGTITRQAVTEVAYFHVELDAHDVVLAEGAPAESFVDDDGAGMFHNAATRRVRRTPAVYCAPRVAGGHGVEAIRQRLAGQRAA